MSKNNLVYLIDDEPLICELISILLEEEGYRIKTFENPEVAYKAFGEGEAPFVVLIDFRIGEIEGSKVLKTIRESHPEQKAVLLTGNNMKEEFEALGFNGYLQKPIHQDVLLKKLAEFSL